MALATPTPAKGPAAVELLDVHKTYGTGRAAREVIKGCSLRVESGRCTVIMGPSGAGKSTLVRLIAGFERPTRGQIFAAGVKVTGPGRDRQVMFQETALFPWMVTEENVFYGPKARGEYGDRARRLGDALIRRVGLDGFRARFPAQLSGGMQRRAELARALINRPSVLILDEPFRGLDAMTKRLMIEYYAELSRESTQTCLFVTTDVDEAIVLADQLVLVTHIPARVRVVIDVDLPRPRRAADLFDGARANDLKRRVLDVLHEEAAKSFAAGERAAADFVDAYRLRLGPPPGPTADSTTKP